MRISDWSSDVCSSDLVAADHEVDRGIGQRRHLLRDAGDAHAIGHVDVAAVGLDLAAQGGEQARLVGSVASDHAHAPTGVQGEVAVGQQQELAAPQGVILAGDHGARILQAATTFGLTVTHIQYRTILPPPAYTTRPHSPLHPYTYLTY